MKTGNAIQQKLAEKIDIAGAKMRAKVQRAQVEMQLELAKSFVEPMLLFCPVYVGKVTIGYNGPEVGVEIFVQAINFAGPMLEIRVLDSYGSTAKTLERQGHWHNIDTYEGLAGEASEALFAYNASLPDAEQEKYL